MNNDLLKRVEKQLMSEMSRRNIDLVCQMLIDDNNLVPILLKLALQHNNKVSIRAFWVLEILSTKLNKPLQKYIGIIISELYNVKIEGSLRIITKILMLHNITKHEGVLFEFCMLKIESDKTPVAIKANCMSLIFNILPRYPELKDEVFILIKDQIPYNNPAFKSRFNKLSKNINLK